MKNKNNKIMTIQEYINVAINRIPKGDFIFYKPFFEKMSCEHCIYKGYACTKPKAEGVCMDYRVEKKHMEFKQ